MRHFYWSVTSTEELQGEVKLAKFEAFLSHVINQHQDLPNRLFKKCHYGPITKEKVWMTKGNKKRTFTFTIILRNIIVLENSN